MAGDELDGPNALSGNREWDPASKTWVEVRPPEPGTAAWWHSQVIAAQNRLNQLYALPPEERALQKDLINNLETQVSSATREFADAYQKERAEYVKAQAAAAKGSGATGGGSGSVSPTVVPPGMTVIEPDPANPGSFNRYIYTIDSSGAIKKVPVAIDAQNPVTANDFMVSPNGDIFSMRSFDNTGSLRQGEKPVFKKDRQYTQVTSAMAPDGNMHTYVNDPRFPEDKYDMGASTDPAVRAQTEALTNQYKATAGKIGVDTETAAFDLEQKRAAVGAGEDVYRKKLTAVEALLKLGKVDEAQKAFSEAQKNWESTASARMREKESALKQGGEAESRAWWAQNNATPEAGKAAWAQQYGNTPGAEGDSFTQRMARQLGYSDAIDYQRGNTPSWGEFVNNTPQGAYGTRNSLETPFKAPIIAGAAGLTRPGGTPPGGTPPALGAEPSAGGRSIDLGGGLYWWDDGSGSGDMFHMAPQATGLLGADGQPEMRMTPTSLDATGVYSGKSLDEARALAHAWFGGGPQQAGVVASDADRQTMEIRPGTPSEDRTMMPIPNAPLTGDPEGDRQMLGAPSGVDRYTDDGMGRTRVGMVGQYPGGLVPALRPGGGGGGAGGGGGSLGPPPAEWAVGDVYSGQRDFYQQILDAAYDPTVYNRYPRIVPPSDQTDLAGKVVADGDGTETGNNDPWWQTAFSDATKRKAMGAIPEVFRSVAAPSISESVMPAWMRAAKGVYNYASGVK